MSTAQKSRGMAQTIGTADEEIAVVLATDRFEDRSDGVPAASLPFGPSKFLQSVVASLSQSGHRHIHIVAHADTAPMLERLVGDGSRWGTQIHWIKSGDADMPFLALRDLARNHERALTLVRGQSWITHAIQAHVLHQRQLAVSIDEQGKAMWRGWARIQAHDLEPLLTCRDATQAGCQLVQRVTQWMILSDRECSHASDTRSLMAAQLAAHRDDLLPLQTGVWMEKPWGFVSAHAHVDNEAEIVGPAWIGAGCVVRAGAHIGRNVTLSRNVVVDKGARIQSAVVMPDAYVGGAFITPGGLLTTAVSAAVAVNRPATQWQRPDARARMAAALGVAALSPLLALSALQRRFKGQPALAWSRQPAVVDDTGQSGHLYTIDVRVNTSPSGWAGNLWALCGGLLDIASGRRHWIGVRPRTPSQWFVLDTEVRQQLNQAPIGLFHAKSWTNQLECLALANAAADVLWLTQRPHDTDAHLPFASGLTLRDVNCRTLNAL